MSVLLSENPKKWRENQVTLAQGTNPPKKYPNFHPPPKKKGASCKPLRGKKKKVKEKKKRGLVILP